MGPSGAGAEARGEETFERVEEGVVGVEGLDEVFAGRDLAPEDLAGVPVVICGENGHGALGKNGSGLGVYPTARWEGR